jgi:hypothetical protein
MKKLLLILAILAIVVPANADVLVYNLKSSNKELWYELGAWLFPGVAQKQFLIIEPNGDEATGWIVGMWKGEDKQKYYDVSALGTHELLEVQTGNKLMWIMTGEDTTSHMLLMGEMKPTKVGNTKPLIAATLNGVTIYDEVDGDNRYTGTVKNSAKLNSSMTLYLAGLSGEIAMNTLFDYLESQGYVED